MINISHFKLFILLFVLLPVIGHTANQKTMADLVSVTDPYVRAVPEGNPNSAAFMQFNNEGTQPAIIVNAESAAANIVELHTHLHEDGMMKMRRIKQIEVPASGETTLKPGGLHIMLMDLIGAIVDGSDVQITLEFSDGSKKELIAPARKMMMKMEMEMKKMEE